MSSDFSSTLAGHHRSFDLVKWELKPTAVLLLELNRPQKLNALNKGLLESLSKLLEVAAACDDVKCVVLTGCRKAFSVGADIEDMAERGVGAYLDDDRLKYWKSIETFPKPIIAAANGYVLGGGCELMMLCDILIATETAKFGQPEIAIASIPGDGGTQRLPRLIGKSMAMQMILTGQHLDARHMLDIGLLSEVVREEDLLTRAIELAELIASHPAGATQLAKAAVLAAYELPLQEGLLRERELTSKTFATEDRVKKLTEFLGKKRNSRKNGEER
jgi:enoyl-CoA hydratase